VTAVVFFDHSDTARFTFDTEKRAGEGAGGPS
jgi:hypothetical protein